MAMRSQCSKQNLFYKTRIMLNVMNSRQSLAWTDYMDLYDHVSSVTTLIELYPSHKDDNSCFKKIKDSKFISQNF
jgi:hypothetical protein